MSQERRAEASTRQFSLSNGDAELVLMKRNGGIGLVESKTLRETV